MDAATKFFTSIPIRLGKLEAKLDMMSEGLFTLTPIELAVLKGKIEELTWVWNGVTSVAQPRVKN